MYVMFWFLVDCTVIQGQLLLFLCFFILKIKPCGLGSRIWGVEAFWYKTEIKIIYFMPLCLIVLIVSDCMVYPDPKKAPKIKYKKIRVSG